jgi:hypothetical protein
MARACTYAAGGGPNAVFVRSGDWSFAQSRNKMLDDYRKEKAAAAS